MERNWLIRTSQNQILGPVTKQRLLDFIQKGALGVLDEVTSGNGYWFSLKEKELVEKYIYGDLPQGYNPISESRSILSKKFNPEKTTSINTAPINSTNAVTDETSNNITQIIKIDFESLNGSTLNKSDLEVPVKKQALSTNENTKLPDQGDLEFPDVSLITSSVNASFNSGDLAINSSLTSAKIPMPIPKPTYLQVPEAKISAEDMILPSEDDLAFPEMDDMRTSPKIEKGKVDLSHQYTRTVALDTQQAASVLPIENEKEKEEDENLSFEIITTAKDDSVCKNEEVSPHSNVPLRLNRNNPKISSGGVTPADAPVKNRAVSSSDEKILLYDKKIKSSVSKGAALRDPAREKHPSESHNETNKRNDNYIFFILIIFALIMTAIFFYFKEILNKPLPI